jgi:hypothetical protein
MFIIPCKYSEGSTIIECINSILEFHPNELIVVVDSYSDNNSYFDTIPKLSNVKILDQKNNNYEVGALWKSYEIYPDESVYILIQDTIIIKHSLSEFINNDKSYTFLYFNEAYPPLTCPNFFENTDYNFRNKPIETIPCCFGTNCIIKRDVMKKFINDNIGSALQINDPKKYYQLRMYIKKLYGKTIREYRKELGINQTNK